VSLTAAIGTVNATFVDGVRNAHRGRGGSA